VPQHRKRAQQPDEGLFMMRKGLTRTGLAAGAAAATVSLAGAAVPASAAPQAAGTRPAPAALAMMAGCPVTAYVLSNGPAGAVTPIRSATNQAGPAIPIGNYPGLLAITPNGKTAYLLNGYGSVIPIRTATNTDGPAIPVEGSPVAMAITPNGKTLYVATRVGQSETDPDAVIPIRTATNTAEPAIGVPPDSHAIAITPDGKTAYVLASTYYLMDSNDTAPGSVTPIKTATNTARPAISDPDSALAMAFTRNGKTAYLLSSDNVTPIKTTTNTPGTAIPVAGNSTAIAVTPASCGCK
jgi:DNA-binding beta-propeller fold protein YncE